MNELEALVQLTTIPYLGSMKIRLLMEQFGSAQAALEADLSEIAEFPGFGNKMMESFRLCRHQGNGSQEIERAEKYSVQLIPFFHPAYPKRLLEIHDFPVLLYMKGELQQNDKQSIAVVGTRQMSIYGGEIAEKLGHDLAAYGFTVVSGLARGIDTAAHRGALRKGRTIAVIGSGLGDIYPQENRALAETIANQGAVISEFSMMTPPDRHNFPQRNRIVSGMTMGTVLVEAPKQSGAMITMEKALAQGRKLFAFPGRADQEYFRGNHDLIKKGMAQLVENAQDVVESFSDLFPLCAMQLPKMMARPPLEKEEEQLLKMLPEQELSFDEIVHLTKWPVMKLNVLIMSLIFKKALKEFPGKIYKKYI